VNHRMQLLKGKKAKVRKRKNKDKLRLI